MQVQIVQLQQEMNLRTRKTMTFAVLELPNGKHVRMPVDETAAAAIIEADIEANGAPPAAETEGQGSLVEIEETGDEDEPTPDVSEYEAPPPARAVVIEETDQHRVVEFGGEVEEVAPPPAPKKRPSKKQKEKQKVARVVEELTAPEPPPPPAPKHHLPEDHVVPQSTQHYKKLVKEGKITPNAFAKHVPKDDWGYPVVQRRPGAEDPARITGQRNQDEDGIGSV